MTVELGENRIKFFIHWTFLSSLDGKESAYNAGDLGSIPGSGCGNNPLHYPCLENSMDRGAWWATVHSSQKELDMTGWPTHSAYIKFDILLIHPGGDAG